MSSRATETDFYAVLEVSPGASAPEIKESYRRMVRLHHPDANPSRREQCERRMKEIIEAYTVLGDPLRRERYDAEQKVQNWENKIGVKSSNRPEPSVQDSLMARVRLTLELNQHEFADRLGLADNVLQEMEQRDEIPKTPIQLRTFTQLCEDAATLLEAEGRSSFANEIRNQLNRKKSHRAFFR